MSKNSKEIFLNLWGVFMVAKLIVHVKTNQEVTQVTSLLELLKKSILGTEEKIEILQWKEFTTWIYLIIGVLEFKENCTIWDSWKAINKIVKENYII